jgi:hypothetical protein
MAAGRGWRVLKIRAGGGLARRKLVISGRAVVTGALGQQTALSVQLNSCSVYHQLIFVSPVTQIVSLILVRQ